MMFNTTNDKCVNVPNEIIHITGNSAEKSYKEMKNYFEEVFELT